MGEAFSLYLMGTEQMRGENPGRLRLQLWREEGWMGITGELGNAGAS